MPNGLLNIIIAGFVVIFGILCSMLHQVLQPYFKYKILGINIGDLVNTPSKPYPLLVLEKAERCYYYESMEIIHGFICLDTITEEKIFYACSVVKKVII